MEQRIKKIKLFRTLKVVYYCLGLPVFFLAVMTLASQMYGHWPFAGNPGDGLFDAIKVFFDSPAMYGVWIAAGIWLVIGLVQIICNFAIKNRRSRALVVVAVMLVVLLVPVFVMDAVFTAKVEKLAADAPDGVTVKDYSYQLSYYHTHTGSDTSANGKKTSLSDTLVQNVEEFCRVYNVPYYGGVKTSKANNFTNTPLYYDQVILSDGTLGYDYDGDGAIDAGDHILIRIPTTAEADKDGRIWAKSLALTDKNGANAATVSGNFYCIKFGQLDAGDYGTTAVKETTCYIWYDGDKGSFEKTEGVYGEAYYNKNGMLSDGYIFSFDVALNILEDYYEAQAEMKTAYAKYSTMIKANSGTPLSEDDLKASIITAAEARLVDRYTNPDNEKFVEGDDTLYARENAMAGSFTLTSGELQNILSVLGEKVGKAQLLEDLLPTISSLIGLSFSISDILGLVGLSDDMAAWASDLLGLTGTTIAIDWNVDHLRIKISGPAGSPFETPVSIEFDDTLSVASIEAILAPLGINTTILAEVINLLGLTVQGGGTLEDMLLGLLSSLYWYASPVLDSVYDYYVDGSIVIEDIKEEDVDPDDSDATDAYATNEANKAILAYQAALAKFSRAAYEGGAHGYMIGSRLVGGSLGDGSYSADQGLTTLAEVQQLKTDVSYQTTMYPLLSVRDMLMTFAAFILFFTIMSYIAADREILYATGKIEPKGKKEKKEKKSKKEDDAAPEEISVGNVEENNEEVH